MKSELPKIIGHNGSYTPVPYELQCHKVKNKLWYVSDLIKATESLEVEERPVEDIRAVRLNLPLIKEPVTHLMLAYHMRVAAMSDMSYPIILARDGRIMDGHHRLIRALADGIPTIKVKQFKEDPAPSKIVSDAGLESLRDLYYWDDTINEYA